MTKMIWRAQVKGCLDWSGSTVHSALRKIRLYSYICSFNVIKYPIDIQFALQYAPGVPLENTYFAQLKKEPIDAGNVRLNKPDSG